MERKIGQYHYGRKYGAWGVWLCTNIREDGVVESEAVHELFRSRNEARDYVYKMNGWGEPKNRVAEF